MTAGLRLLLMENALSYSAPQGGPELDQQPEAVSAGLAALGPEMAAKLQELIHSICLANPFWNDFRLLHYFDRQGFNLSIKDLHYLKSQSGVGSRIAVYHELLNFYRAGLHLTEQQIRFIERLNPAFRDRAFKADQPGQLMLYDCLSSRRLQHKINGQRYLHLFIDRFNGYSFAIFHPERSIQIGYELLVNTIRPFYHCRQSTLSTVMCSTKTAIIKDLSVSAAARGWGLSWQETPSSFGTVDSFHKFLLSHFFEGLRLYQTAPAYIESAFKRWLIQYNFTHSFHQRRDFLSYVEFGQCMRLTLD